LAAFFVAFLAAFFAVAIVTSSSFHKVRGNLRADLEIAHLRISTL